MNPANSENPANPVTIGVVGAGTMGNGIAQVSARAGYNVIMHDVREEFLDRGLVLRYVGVIRGSRDRHVPGWIVFADSAGTGTGEFPSVA